jgi:hypothetical protein
LQKQEAIRVGVLNSGLVLRRLKKLEQTLQVDNLEVAVDIVFWDGAKGGLFGHAYYRYSGNGGKTEALPCSAEKEIELMKEDYERDGHRVFGKGDEVSFAGYLENFCYLGPEALAAERKAVIERLRGEVNGA